MGWLERLHVEECAAGFDRRWAVKKAGDAAGFRFITDPATGAAQILLQGMGPKLLLSDASTGQQPLLRWRLVVRGNTAVEFGVVPADMQVRSCRVRELQQTADWLGFGSQLCRGDTPTT
jgi:hypothetical protein